MKRMLRDLVAANPPVLDACCGTRMMWMEKRCTKCGKLKPLSEYGADKKSRDGKRQQCRECRTDASKAYYAQTSEDQREQWKANARTRYADDIEKSRARNRRYHHENKGRINAKQEWTAMTTKVSRLVREDTGGFQIPVVGRL